jgi:hypothetical protein
VVGGGWCSVIFGVWKLLVGGDGGWCSVSL